MSRSTVVAVVLAVGLVFSLLGNIGGVVAAVAVPDRLIHVLKGKTGAEYNEIVSSLDKTKADLTQAQTDRDKNKTDLDAANKEIGNLKGQITGLQGAIKVLEANLVKWKGLLCEQTWAQATDKDVVFSIISNDKATRDFFNMLGIDVLVTQWKTGITQNQTANVLVQDLNGGMILDVTQHCFILSTAKGAML